MKRLFLIVLAVAVVTAAGVGVAFARSAPRRYEALPTMSGAVVAHGGVEATSEFHSLLPGKTCDVLGSQGGAPGRFGVVTGRNSVGVVIDHYTGPGRYADPKALVFASFGGTEWKPGPASSAEILVAHNGSGTASFANYAAADGRTISGSMWWTCTPPDGKYVYVK